MKSLVAYVAISLLASSDRISCFSPASVIKGARSSSPTTSASRTALSAAQFPTATTATTTTAANGRRQFLLNGALSTATSTFLLSLSSSLAIAPIPAFADDVVVPPPPSPPIAPPSYVSSIGDSATALSQSLGHAISVIDALNAQASRLSSPSASTSPSYSAHNVAVLDGMTAQSRRLVRDLDHCANVLESIIKDDGYDITSGYPNDKLQVVAKNVSHASSVLDGLVVQGRRLERAIIDVVSTTASSSGGGGKATDDKIVYMLSVLDGLNAQVERLDIGTTFEVLDEVVAEATRGA